MGTVNLAPFLPVHGEKENKLFANVFRSEPSCDLDMDKMVSWIVVTQPLMASKFFPSFQCTCALIARIGSAMPEVRAGQPDRVAAKGKLGFPEADK